MTSLVKKIDRATAEHQDAHMGSFVVMLSDDETLEHKLKDLAAREKLKHVVLTIDNKAGPPRWRIARDADVAVVLYVRGAVKANHAFLQGRGEEGRRGPDRRRPQQDPARQEVS
jgi:hypothetical protein